MAQEGLGNAGWLQSSVKLRRGFKGRVRSLRQAVKACIINLELLDSRDGFRHLLRRHGSLHQALDLFARPTHLGEPTAPGHDRHCGNVSVQRRRLLHESSCTQGMVSLGSCHLQRWRRCLWRRRCWLKTKRTLSVTQRKHYIKAVKCLMNKAPVTFTTNLPGVTSRYEDFLGTHIAQVGYVHFVV